MCKARLDRKPLLMETLAKGGAGRVLLLAKISFGMTQTELRRLGFLNDRNEWNPK